MELLMRKLSKMSTRIFFHWEMLLNMPILCLNVSTEVKQVMENIGIYQSFMEMLLYLLYVQYRKRESLYYLFTLFVCRPITSPCNFVTITNYTKL